MTTATQKSELLEALQSQWEEIYTQSLNDVLSDNSLTAETKTEGIMLMLFHNVQKLMVLFVQELTDIMSLITLEKGKDASHSVGYYQ